MGGTGGGKKMRHSLQGLETYLQEAKVATVAWKRRGERLHRSRKGGTHLEKVQLAGGEGRGKKVWHSHPGQGT